MALTAARQAMASPAVDQEKKGDAPADVMPPQPRTSRANEAQTGTKRI